MPSRFLSAAAPREDAGAETCNRFDRPANREPASLYLHEDGAVLDAGVKLRERRWWRPGNDLAIQVVHAAVARTEDPFRLAVVARSAAEMRARRMQRAHFVVARLHQIDNGAIHDVREAVLSRHAQRDGEWFPIGQIVEG